ncbi:MAG: lysylphosphatidylglycerol synthase transmembrane domain-containing protein [Anaerolineaceae bacterium]|nr:lysylphosphatidylglycerol synthase transmembrane domain-containing protein [Anaerolineaceae bacterium]
MLKMDSDSSAENPPLRLPVKRLLAGPGIALAIYLAMLLAVNSLELLQQLGQFPVLLLLPLAMLKVLTWLCRFVVWQHFLDVAGIRDRVNARNSAILYLAGLSLSVSPGKSAEALKALVLRRWAGLPLSIGLPVVMAERVVETLSVLILSALVLAAGAADLAPVLARHLLILATAVVLTGLLFLHSPSAQRRMLAVVANVPLLRHAIVWLRGFIAGSSQMLQVRNLLRALVPAMLATTGDALVLLVILDGFGLALNTELLFQALLIVSLTPLIGALSGLPNGAGITELSVATMLLTLVAPSQSAVTPSSAAAVALIEGFFHKWLRVLVGLLVALVFRKRLFSTELPAEAVGNSATATATAGQGQMYDLES